MEVLLRNLSLRDLRQGDPLAPLLFNIVVEGLTGLMRSAVTKNLFSSYQVGKKKEEVNILQYADDTLFFGAATNDNVRVLKCILKCFELVSGLKINYNKSQFGCLGKSEGWCREATSFLNCSQLEFPFSYLGIPVGVSSKCRNNNVASPWWKDLKVVFQQQQINTFCNHLKWKLGSGDKISFWKDKWLHDNLTLQQKYPTLYQISGQQSSTINLMGELVAERWEWKLKWRRHFFDHKIQLIVAFLAELENVHITQSSRDSLIWQADPNGIYSTKSAYTLLQEADREVLEDSASKIIWSLQIPPRATAFSWRLLKNRIPTKANLRRQVEMPSYNCPLCESEEETTSHVLFSCTKTRILWWEAMSWVNKVGPLPIEPNNHFLQFSHWNAKRSTNKRWEALWITLSMTIWKHRNNMVFNNQLFIPEKVMDEALFHTWSWLRCMEKDFNTHFNHWSSNLREEFS
ncbi:uncharacterized protein LOC114371346 [Glycine soja]|uniref:uncharacterized protein LOC114371346 n=1 Tax=Glycine soja TaxID=3848 RepID=UPI00103D4FD7|nr:uncharacterized protein LOC114371346 [Glycine soja]